MESFDEYYKGRHRRIEKYALIAKENLKVLEIKEIEF